MAQPIGNFQEFERYLASFTNYERLQFPPYDKKSLGTRRIEALLRLIGNPHLAQPAVHVAGSKGKGSTCLILEAILLAHGYTVGTYLSPHVEHLRERIRVGGNSIAEDELVETLRDMFDILESLREKRPEAFPSFFELMTALAMAVFRKRRVDWGIFEVGLGGRLDATNVLSPRICAVTSIELEHTEQLGHTLGAIAREKAGIIKPGSRVVLGPLDPEAYREISRIARARGARCLRSEENSVATVEGGRLRIRAPELMVPAGRIVGPGLRTDLAIAITIAREVLSDEKRELDPVRLAEALSGLELPARVEIFPGPPPAVIDGAHTERAIQTLKAALEEIRFPRPRVLVFSLAHGKEVGRILPQLPGLAERVIFTRADPIRSIPPEDLRSRLAQGSVEERPEDALERAREIGQAIVVTGSFYLAGRLRPILRRSAERGAPAQCAPPSGSRLP